MNRRSLLKRAAAFAFMPALFSPLRAASPENAPARRLRPSDPEWPDKASWAKLNEDVGGRLIRVNSPLSVYTDVHQPRGAEYPQMFGDLRLAQMQPMDHFPDRPRAVPQ